MIAIDGFTALKNLQSTYKEFLQNPEKRYLAIIGRYHVGKRWHLKKSLSSLNLEAKWITSISSDEELKNLLSSDEIIVFYEKARDLFEKKKNRAVLEQDIEFSNKHTLPGKIIIIDEPFVKLPSTLKSNLEGFQFTFTIKDLLSYVELEKESIAKEHSLKIETIDLVLSVYKIALENKIIKAEEEIINLGTSIYGVAKSASIIEKDKQFALTTFPQEVMGVAKHVINKETDKRHTKI